MKVIGVTGNSGSGKSYGCTILEQIGAEVISLDQIGHSLYDDPNCYYEIIKKIRGDILTNRKIDRKKLSDVVFSDLAKLRLLTKITDKYIYDKTKELIRKTKKDKIKSFVVIDGAMLFDSKVLNLVDDVILIEADREIKIKRIMDRDLIFYDDAIRRIGAQKSYLDFEYRKKHILYNNGDKIVFKSNLLSLIDKII